MTNPEFLATTIPLRAVVERGDLNVAVLAGGDSDEALDKPVRWAHVSEVADPVPYLLGQELLLSAGVNLIPKHVDNYVAGLVSAGVTALGFGITPVFDAVPDELVAACARHGLPLLAIPESTPFLAVCRAVGEELTNRTQSALRRLSAAQHALTQAAASSEPRPALLRTLTEWIGGWAELVESSTDARQAGELSTEVRALAERVRGSPGTHSAATQLDDGTHVVAQPVHPGTLVLAVGKPGRFDVTDRGVIAVGLALLGIAAGQAAGAALGALSTGLLIGDEASPAEVLGRHDSAYRVVTGDSPALPEQLDTPLVRATDKGCAAIVPQDIDPGRLDGLAAVSRPYPAHELPEAARQARLLLERARALGRSLHAEQADSRFASAVDPRAARSFARTLLDPVPEQLIPTLRTWLAQHGNWDRTAAAMNMHRNSVRHRIGRVERLLGVDLADAQARMELWFALQWGTTDERGEEHS